MTRSLLLQNANIYLGSGRFARSLLAVDGVIRAVGSDEAMAACAPAGVEVLNAEGRTAVPAFNDSHCHLLMLGRALEDIRLHGTSGIADLKARVRRYIAERRPAPGTVLHGMGWNQDYFEDERRLPTAADLDEAAPGYPLVLERACGHILVASTAAMRLAGITNETAPLPGGAIDRDGEGRATGIFRENACAQVMRILPAPTLDSDRRALQAALWHAAACGVGSAHSMDVRGGNWRDVLALYRSVLEETPSLRVNHQCCFMEENELADFLAAGNRTGTVAGHAMNRVGPLKLFVDGSLGARTAYMREPYHDAPETRGISTLTPEQLDALVVTAVEHNCGVAIHAIGDAAVEEVLDAYDRVCTDGMNPNRLGIIHVQITDRPLVERFTKNHILALVQPIFLHYDTTIVEDRVGKDLAATSYAFGTMKKLGIHMSFGTDSPIEDMNPIDNLYCAVTRSNLKGEPAGGFHPEECLDIYDAVDAYTTESAYATFEEDIKGRLLPGYYADLVVLSENIFEMPKTELRRTKVDATMVGGRFVFMREGA